LQKEVRVWRKEGIVSSEQAQTILSRPSYVNALTGAPSHRLIYLFAVLGGLLVGVGLILFFSSNWRQVPDAGKLALIFAGVLVPYALALRFKFKSRPSPALATGLFLLGGIAYGSGIFLVAQIYNFHADWRTGILYWFLGALPLAYAVDSRPVLWLSLGALIFWLSSKFGFREVTILQQVLGGILILVAVRHWKPLGLPRFAKIYFVLGSGLVLYTTLVMTFDDFLPTSEFRVAAQFGTYFATLGFLYVGLLLGVLLSRQSPDDLAQRRLVVLLSSALAPAATVAMTGLGPDLEVGWPFLVFVNLLLFAECVGLILFGVATQGKLYVNVGIGFFLVLVVCRYFDTYWEYLPRSLFFIFGGLLLLVTGYFLESKRRQWIAQFDQEAMP